MFKGFCSNSIPTIRVLISPGANSKQLWKLRVRYLQQMEALQTQIRIGIECYSRFLAVARIKLALKIFERGLNIIRSKQYYQIGKLLLYVKDV